MKNPDEAYDAIPEIWEGKNIADFVDPDIIAKLDALEKEEEEREKNGFYNLDGLNYDSGKYKNPRRDIYFSLDDMEILEMAKRIRKKRKINKIEARLEDKTCGRSKLFIKNIVRFHKNFIFRPKTMINSFYVYFQEALEKR